MAAKWPRPEPPPPREKLMEVLAQKPPLFPRNRPSHEMRPYVTGDAVAINEVVLRHVQTGETVVVYPGSQEAAERSWPLWEQVYV